MSIVSGCSFQLEIVELSMSSYQKHVLSFRKILFILEREKILGFLNFGTFPQIFLDSWKLRGHIWGNQEGLVDIHMFKNVV
jgi:hypothetical protein